MKGQLQEMQVIAQEKEDEAALREVLFKEKSTFEKNEKDKDTSPTHASPATLSGSTDTKTADVAIMPPTAPAQTRVRSNDTQFALLERLFGLLSEGQPESVEGGMYSPEALLSTLLSSSGNGLNKWDQATILLNLCIQLVESPTDGAHKLARVYVQRCVFYVFIRFLFELWLNQYHHLCTTTLLARTHQTKTPNTLTLTRTRTLTPLTVNPHPISIQQQQVLPHVRSSLPISEFRTRVALTLSSPHSP